MFWHCLIYLHGFALWWFQFLQYRLWKLTGLLVFLVHEGMYTIWFLRLQRDSAWTPLLYKLSNMPALGTCTIGFSSIVTGSIWRNSAPTVPPTSAGDTQCGFHSGPEATQQIYTLQHIFEKHWYCIKDVYFVESRQYSGCVSSLIFGAAWFQAIFHSWFKAMYLFANSPTVDTLVCKPTSAQLVAVSCGACEQPKFLFTVSLHWTICIPRTFQRYLVLTSHSSVLKIVLYIGI